MIYPVLPTLADTALLPSRVPRATCVASAPPVFIFKVKLESPLNDCVLLRERP